MTFRVPVLALPRRPQRRQQRSHASNHRKQATLTLLLL